MPGSLRRQIGRLLIAGFGGHQVPVELASLAREFSLGGVILFARNVAEPEQVAELCYESARLVPDLPLWVSVDQEGGRVARLKAPFTEWPPMATLGRSGDVGLAERFARALAAELKATGITLDYAPVLDERLAATLSKRVVGDMLRRELGFEGVILSDDLEMKAIANNYEVPEAAVMAIDAGCDGVLICSADYDTQARTLEAIVKAVET